MATNEPAVTADGKKPASPRTSRLPRVFFLLSRALFLFGFFSLSYILGAIVIYFDLPTSVFLRRSFGGAVAWYESSPSTPTNETASAPSVGQVDKPNKTCDGFTLCMYGGNSRAVLIDMLGKVVHEWHIPFSNVWTDPPHLKGRIDNASVYFNDGYLYPNGDLVLVVEGPINTSNSSNGYGLIKIDKDSKLIWKYAEHCHHDLDVGDDGKIYALVNEVVDHVPMGLEHIPTPCMVDSIDVLSPEGQRLKRIRLLEAFKSSDYAPLLGTFEKPRSTTASVPVSVPMFRQDELRRDVLHTNAVKVLNRALAPKFPLFRAGQLLTSPRNLDALAVIDPESEKVVWAARGPWRAQHDPTFLASGHLLLFDNLGALGGSRVLELDPNTLSFPWSYPGETGQTFFSQIRGLCQRLPNGNTLIVNSVGCEVFEVTSQREIVWSCSTGKVTLNRARRHMPDNLHFLKGDQRARP
jgi:hypothetical protein